MRPTCTQGQERGQLPRHATRVIRAGSTACTVKQLTQQAMDDLVAAVEAGKSDRLKAYFGMLGRFHRYSFGNVLLIASQRPGATFVAGYRGWQELGRQVRQGERAIRILAPIRRRRHAEKKAVVDRDEDGPEAEQVPVAFRTAHVFDVCQTEGKPLPEFAQVGGDPGGAAERLRALVAQKGVELQYCDALSSASGYSAGGRIVLRKGMTPAEEFSTMVHELAHEMLHQDEEDGPGDRRGRETEAEAVAFAVCQAVGLNTNTASSDYIQLYRGGKETLLASLERIREAAHEILEAVLPARLPLPDGRRSTQS